MKNLTQVHIAAAVVILIVGIVIGVGLRPAQQQTQTTNSQVSNPKMFDDDPSVSLPIWRSIDEQTKIYAASYGGLDCINGEEWVIMHSSIGDVRYRSYHNYTNYQVPAMCDTSREYPIIPK